MIRFAKIIFPISLCLWLVSSIFFNYQENIMTMKYQELLNEIEIIKLYNKDLELEITKLKNKDRIFKIALENDMVQDLDRIFNVQ